MPLRHAAMLEVNEFLVLDFVRERQQATRPEIGRALDLSAASVSRIVARLLRAGLVVESGASPAGGGRPAAVIAFNRRAGAVVAVVLAASHCVGALADLSGEVLCQEIRLTGASGGAFAALTAAIADLRAKAVAQAIPVSTVAVGVPAILDPATGLGIGGPRVEWDGFEVVGRLAQQLDVPFTVENDVNLAALAHAWRGEGRQVDDFATLWLGIGVGGAVVSNGQLVKGRHNAAGEMGYLVVDVAQLSRPLNHGLGGLEEVASEAAVVGRTRALLEGDGSASQLRGRELSVASIIAAAVAGDTIATQVVRELLDNVSLALVAICAIVDPGLIVLDGSVGQLLGPYLPDLSGQLARRVPLPPRLAISPFGASAPVIGAVAAALQLARQRTAPSALFGVFDVSRGMRSGA